MEQHEKEMRGLQRQVCDLQTALEMAQQENRMLKRKLHSAAMAPHAVRHPNGLLFMHVLPLHCHSDKVYDTRHLTTDISHSYYQ